MPFIGMNTKVKKRHFILEVFPLTRWSSGSCTRTMRINIAGAPIDYYRTKKVSKRELS